MFQKRVMPPFVVGTKQFTLTTTNMPTVCGLETTFIHVLDFFVAAYTTTCSFVCLFSDDVSLIFYFALFHSRSKKLLITGIQHLLR